MPLVLNPSSRFIEPNEQLVLEAQGGVEPYSFSLAPGGAGGALSPYSSIAVVYTAPDANGFEGVVVTDANGDTFQSDVTIQPTLYLSPTKQVLAQNLTYPFGGFGGTPPYLYSVLPNGVGGTIDTFTGVYTSPGASGIDIIEILDQNQARARALAQVGTPLELFCDILQRELGLADGRVFIWDQKINAPIDLGLYIAVQVMGCKPFANSRKEVPDATLGMIEVQSANMMAMLQIDAISRDTSALLRKEEILMALNSTYAESQQELNSFKIGTLPTGFVNVSQIDGAAIPYRFSISVNMQYTISKTRQISYFDTFQPVEVTTDA